MDSSSNSSSESDDAVRLIERYKTKFIKNFNSDNVAELNINLNAANKSDDILSRKIRRAKQYVQKAKIIRENRNKYLALKQNIYQKTKQLAKIKAKLGALKKNMLEFGNFKTLYTKILSDQTLDMETDSDSDSKSIITKLTKSTTTSSSTTTTLRTGENVLHKTSTNTISVIYWIILIFNLNFNYFFFYRQTLK